MLVLMLRCQTGKCLAFRSNPIMDKVLIIYGGGFLPAIIKLDFDLRGKLLFGHGGLSVISLDR